MTATQLQWDQLNGFICATCGHRAVQHFVHRGPCSGCWAECLTICERFVVLERDLLAVTDLLAVMMGVTDGS